MDQGAPRGPDAIARRLAALLAHAPREAPRIEPLVPGRAPKRVAAVDGSSIVLAESGNRLLGAYRAGRVALVDGARAASVVGEPEVILLEVEPKYTLDAMRTAAEMQHAMEALEALAVGDLLLMDGALRSHVDAPLLDEVLARAAKQKVDVVGVCKSTSMTLGGVPALVACQLAVRGGTKASESVTWSAALPTPPNIRGECHAARLSAAEPRTFRFDIASSRPARDVLSGIAALCGHPAYPGYPSPLAMAHNAVLLNEDARRRLRSTVHEAALKAGVDEDTWDAAFVDYHDVLELGA